MTIAVWFQWIKIIPFFLSDHPKMYFWGMPQNFSRSFLCAMRCERSRIAVLPHCCLQACGFSCRSPLFVSITEVIISSPLICFCLVFYLHCHVFTAKGCELWHELAAPAWQGFYPVLEDLIPPPPPVNVRPYRQVVLDILFMLGLGENWGTLLSLAPKGYPELYLRDLCLEKDQS